ncbi:MAG: DUF2974 domain-containing protein [Bacilli bacterium]|nr:DUF2974 domain-containing protein [Bacilli bacterium]
MTIFDYVKKYGDYSFEEKEFTEVDCVIFSFLGYADMEGIITKYNKMTLKEVAEKLLELHRNKEKNIIATREAIKLFIAMKDTKRYKDCLIYHYDYIGNFDLQFGVFSIEYQKNKVFVTFEGTDQLFSGWIEDFMLSCEFPTISHKKAINYLNKYYTFNNKELIIGGHSKGGNLALVAGMYANFIVRSKIKFICNADGPGLLDKQFYSSRYRDISDKYIHIIPESSYIGLFLNHDHDKIIKASNKGVLSHAANFWVVEDDHFVGSVLNPMSQKLDIRLKEWLNKYNDKDKFNFVSNLDMLLRRANVSSALELVSKNTKLFRLLREANDIDEETKKQLGELLSIVIDCFKATKKEEFAEFISNVFKTTKHNEVNYENIND